MTARLLLAATTSPGFASNNICNMSKKISILLRPNTINIITGPGYYIFGVSGSKNVVDHIKIVLIAATASRYDTNCIQIAVIRDDQQTTYGTGVCANLHRNVVSPFSGNGYLESRVTLSLVETIHKIAQTTFVIDFVPKGTQQRPDDIVARFLLTVGIECKKRSSQILP